MNIRLQLGFPWGEKGFKDENAIVLGLMSALGTCKIAQSTRTGSV